MKIITLGDSLTYGFPYTMKESWVYLVSKELNINMANRGVNGAYTEEMRARVQYDIAALQPTHMTIMGGTNDAFMGFPASTVGENLAQVVSCCLEHNVVPILGIPIPCLSEQEERLLEEYRAWMRDYAGKKMIEIIDFYSAMVDTESSQIKEELYFDSVHPNLAGYQRMAEAAREVLGKLKSCK